MPADSREEWNRTKGTNCRAAGAGCYVCCFSHRLLLDAREPDAGWFYMAMAPEGCQSAWWLWLESKVCNDAQLLALSVSYYRMHSDISVVFQRQLRRCHSSAPLPGCCVEHFACPAPIELSCIFVMVTLNLHTLTKFHVSSGTPFDSVWVLLILPPTKVIPRWKRDALEI